MSFTKTENFTKNEEGLSSLFFVFGLGKESGMNKILFIISKQ